MASSPCAPGMYLRSQVLAPYLTVVGQFGGRRSIFSGVAISRLTGWASLADNRPVVRNTLGLRRRACSCATAGSPALAEMGWLPPLDIAPSPAGGRFQ